MGQCIYCGERAGWFREVHPACETMAEGLRQRIINAVEEGVDKSAPYSELKSQVESLVNAPKISVSLFSQTIKQAVNDAVTKRCMHTPLDGRDFDRLWNIITNFEITGNLDECKQRRWFSSAAVYMSHTLWLVLNDIDTEYPIDQIRFNLQRDEVPIFNALAVGFAEERTTRQWNFGGLSVPVGAGVYYHMGSAHGHNATSLAPVDAGEMLITNRSIYFGGQRRTLRISLSSVLRYLPYVDAIGVCESNGLPKVFIPDYSGFETGWFFYNLLSALTNKLNQRAN